MSAPKCPQCGEYEPDHKLEDCPATWDAEKTRKAYLKARVVLRRLVSGNINAPWMWGIAVKEAEDALNPQ